MRRYRKDAMNAAILSPFRFVMCPKCLAPGGGMYEDQTGHLAFATCHCGFRWWEDRTTTPTSTLIGV